MKRLPFAVYCLALTVLAFWTAGFAQEPTKAKKDANQEPAKSKKDAKPEIPAKVLKVLEYIDEHDKARDGYEGGRTFMNFEKLLPQKDKDGKRVRYREWDVNPLKAGVNRGAERLVTGSDGHAYYTSDHYKSFKKIR